MGIVYALAVVAAVMLFYWEGIWAYFDSPDIAEIKFILKGLDNWYMGSTDYWRPVWHGYGHFILTGFGLNPVAFHIFNLFLYLCLLWLTYRIYTIFTQDRALCWIALLLFATFYLHAEIVSKYVSSDDLLWTIFGLLALVVFCRYRETRKPVYYLFAILSTLLSSLSKEPAVILPLLFLVTDYYKYPHDMFSPSPWRRKGVLLHIPFFLIAASTAATFLLLPKTPLFHIRAQYLSSPFDIVVHAGYLVAYSLSPSFLGARLTPLAALVIIALNVYIFFSSSNNGKGLFIFLWVCMVIALIPYTLTGIVPRYVTFSSVFSLLLVTLILFETCTLAWEKVGSPSSDKTKYYITTMMLLLPFIYINYGYVRRYTENSVYAGKLLRAIIEGTMSRYPTKENKRIIYVNLPERVRSKQPFTAIIVAYGKSHKEVLKGYCHWYGLPSPVNGISEINLDLPYPPQDERTWYDHFLEDVPHVSSEEFNRLASESQNQVLFFSPVSEQLVDVSGWNYEQLSESILNVQHPM